MSEYKRTLSEHERHRARQGIDKALAELRACAPSLAVVDDLGSIVFVEVDSANLGRQRVAIDPLNLLSAAYAALDIERTAPEGLEADNGEDWARL